MIKAIKVSAVADPHSPARTVTPTEATRAFPALAPWLKRKRANPLTSVTINGVKFEMAY